MGGTSHAVVLSGGGSRGAYEVGVVRALMEGKASSTGGRPLRPGVFTGTSVGAYNATLLAQEADAPGTGAVDRLEEIWRRRIASGGERCGNGVYRLRADPFRVLAPGCARSPFQLLGDLVEDARFFGDYAFAYGEQLLQADGPLLSRLMQSVDLAALFSREPLEGLLRDTIDLDRLRAAPSRLAIVTADWINGRPKVWSKADLTDRLGVAPVLASTAIPGIFHPVELEGGAYADGGLVMNTPLAPAIAEGADVLHVVYVDPYVADVPLPELPNTLAVFNRIYTILFATQVNADTRHAAAINEELAERPAARGSELPAVRARRQLDAARRGPAGAAAAAGDDDHVYRPVEIHRYRPGGERAGAPSLLDFSAALIDELIAAGHRDALAHDCSREGCVLPPATAGAARA
jgi:NTE family protein